MENLHHIYKSVYRVEVPLPNNPLKSINSYLIPTDSGLLVIDAGLNLTLCENVWKEAVNSIHKSSGPIDFLITHMHADHCALLSRVSTDSSVIYASREDMPLIVAQPNQTEFWENVKSFALKYGFPPELAEEAILQHPGFVHGVKEKPAGSTHIINDGDIIIAGDIRLEVIKTPGHSPGHICIYDRENGVLFSGDHVLSNITPNISAGFENPNPLKHYLLSLRKIYNLNVSLVLPGHRKPFDNLKKRIREIENHHRERLREIVHILETAGESDAFFVASRMSWDINYSSFEEFPLPQKWFAHGEAIAHLLYLNEQKKVSKREKDGVFVFSLH